MASVACRTLVRFSVLILSVALGVSAHAADEGGLSVQSDPAGAAVYVDGRFIGQTPLTVPSLAAGEHRLRIAKDGYLENRRSVRVTSGRTETVTLRLTSRSGPQAPAQAGGLRIVVVEGEDAVNIIQQGTAVRPIVEVRDRNNLPVAGATVVFTIGGGGGATFAGGATTLTVTTNAAGRAAVTELNPLANGSFQINVEASYQGQTASTSISQTNVATPADAAKMSQSGVQAGAAGGGAAGGGLSGLAIAGIAGGAAAGTLVGLRAGGVIGGGDDPCTFAVTPTTITVGSAAGSSNVSVTASPSGCTPDTWSASSGAAFATVNPASGTGNGTVTVTVTANTGAQRTATLTIAGQTVTLTQGAACVFAVSPSSTTVPGTGGTVSVSVSVSPAGCAPTTWTAASNAAFITVSPASGTGNANVTLSVTANPGAARSGTVTIAGQTVSLTQGEAARPCNAQQVAGGDVPEARTIELGRTSGTFTFSYDTASIEDRLLVRYEGRVLFDTGCVGTNGLRTQSVTYSGNASTVTIEVTPNCRVPGSGTAWAFVVSCPQ